MQDIGLLPVTESQCTEDEHDDEDEDDSKFGIWVDMNFSGVTYATIGYGDLVLPKEWRLFGPVEGLTGILMCGLSTAFR